MRTIIQRVTRATVSVDGELIGVIDGGLLVLLGITHTDSRKDADYLLNKLVALRIFDDAAGKMNKSLLDTGGGLLIVSQFTLYGEVQRGLRPSWSEAAPASVAEPLYDYFLDAARKLVERVEGGSFGKMMQVELVNDGPVTLIIDSRK